MTPLPKSTKPTRLVTTLANAFGADALKIHSQYHIRVATGGGVHDVYTTREGKIRVLLAGQVRPQTVNLSQLISSLSSYSSAKSDIERMKHALSLTTVMSQAMALQKQITGPVIYVDAGWKDGKGRIGVIFVAPVPDAEPTIHAMAKTVDAKTNVEAERMAVLEGLKKWGQAPVLTDCKSVADEFADNPRVRWISRTANKAADAIGNMRKEAPL